MTDNADVNAAFFRDAAENLPPPTQLSVSYAPAKARSLWQGFFVLDRRFAQIVATASEPMLAQVRLAWWRENLEKPSPDRPAGEPLLHALAGWDAECAALAALADGWEALIGETPLDPAAFAALAGARAGAAAALVRLLDRVDLAGVAETLGYRWGLADIALHLGNEVERGRVSALLRAAEPAPRHAPRMVRPMAVLAALSVRALGEMRAIGGAGDMAVAMRIGILGW